MGLFLDQELGLTTCELAAQIWVRYLLFFLRREYKDKIYRSI